MSQPPSLYDTSISSGAESQSQSHSWSTGSAGRQKQQQPYFPKSRPQQQPQSPSNASSRYPSWAMHSPRNSNSNSISSKRTTQSEPGVPEQLPDQDSFLAHVHRFAAMEQKYASTDINVNVGPGPYNNGGTRTLKSRTTMTKTKTKTSMQQQYPDPELQMEESVVSEEPRPPQSNSSDRLSRYEQYTRSMDSSSNNKNNATRSTRPSTSSQPPPPRKDTSYPEQQMEESVVSKESRPPQSNSSDRLSRYEQYTRSMDSSSNNKNNATRSTRPSTSSQPPPRKDTSSSPSFQQQQRPESRGRSRQSLDSQQPPPQRQSFDSNTSSRGKSLPPRKKTSPTNANIEYSHASSIETPSPARVQKIKRQLWDDKESLQVAHPPTLSYADYATYSEKRLSSRSSRSVSPRKREESASAVLTPTTPSRRQAVPSTSTLQVQAAPSQPPPKSPEQPEEDQKFKTKFYQAALQARLAKPLSLASVNTSNRSMSFSEMSRPFDEEPVRVVVAAEDASKSKRHSNGLVRSVNTSFGSNSNSNSATVVMTNPAPTTPRSWADPSKPPRGREASVERRGLESPVPVERRRGRESPVERRGREQSVERATRELSIEAPKRVDIASHRQSKVSSNATNATTATTTEQPHKPPGAAPPPSPQSFHRSASWSSGKEAEKKIMQVKKYDSTTTDSISLVDKLKAIRRDNPADALAQIDAILRQESRSMSGDPAAPRRRNSTDTRDEEATPAAATTTNDQDQAEEEDEEETDSDDQTSVSSMTNPTYQSVRQDRAQAQAQIHGQNPFGDTNSFSNTFGQQQQPASTTNPFATTNPSTASFRKPRPSALSGYTASPSQEIPTVPQQESRSKEKKRMLKEFPPPITIKVKDTPTRRAPSPIHDLSPSPINTRAVANSMNPFEQETPKAATTPPAKKLDKFMANSAELANKIRLWDEMSNGRQKSVSGDSAKHKEERKMDDMRPHHALPKPPSVSPRRSHPWDNSISARHERVEPRDTSMDQGMGVEMEVPSRNTNNFESFEQSFENTPVEESSQQPVQFRRTNSTPVPSSNSNPFEAFESEPNLFSSDAGAAGEWDVSTLRFTPERQENSQKISDAFDQAWVSLPPSSFSAAPLFAEPTTQHQTFEEPARTTPIVTTPPRRPASSVEASQTVPTTPRSLQLPKQPPQDLQQSTYLGGVEVSLVEDDPHQQDSQTDAKEKRRGFFRAFKRKDTKTKNDSLASACGSASGDGTQTSLTPPPPRQREQPPLPTLASPRGRRGSRTPTQGAGNSPSRSNSVERFRSASMAHKFSRVNRLYDRD